MEDITRETIKDVNIEDLAMNQRFGALKFENANSKLRRMQEWISQFEDLDYQSELTQESINQINNHIQQFVDEVNWLQTFDLSTSSNPKQDHDAYESRIDNFYNSFSRIVHSDLVYLRQEFERKNTDKKAIKKEQSELIRLKKESADLVKQLTKEIQEIKEVKNKEAAAKGERAAVRFGKHFEAQAKENDGLAKMWLAKRDVIFKILVWVICINLGLYILLFITFKLDWWPNMNPSEFFTIQYGLVKLALISILSYSVSFNSRNFNINSNLVANNKHRKNVAETLNDFLETNPEKEDRSKIVESATDTMFKHQPIGYLPKIEAKDDGPVSSILTNIVRPLN